MLKAKVFQSPNKCMKGKELRRLLSAANMSEEVLANRLEVHRTQIRAWQNAKHFCIHPIAMRQLLSALGAKIR